MKKLHQHLESKLPWYKKWHETEHHKVVHYAILALTIVFTIGLIISSTATKAVGTTYYISPTGSNTASGTQTAPWKTLTYACSTVTTSGSIIHILPGTYTETAACNLKVGVNIEGEGVSSHITSTYTGISGAIQLISSTDGTSGDQHISGIWLDGSNWTAMTGINVNRSNVKIYDCTVENFVQNGITFLSLSAPSNYITGDELYNCKLNNSGGRDKGGYGSLAATGYRGILIHDNIFDQRGRPAGQNGNTFSATSSGYSEGFKFYNNKSYRLPYEGTDNNTGWGFHLEMWGSQGGMEVYNNEFYDGLQGIDWAGEEATTGIIPGTYPYAAYVHDNLFKINTPHSVTPNSPTSVIGTNLEGNIDGIIIANNHYVNYPYPVQATMINTTTYLKNITIRNNLFENTGYTNDGYTFDISLLTSNCPDTAHCKSLDGVKIYNNTMKSPNAQASIFVYANPTASKTNNVQIINNIVQSAGSAWLQFNDSGVQSNYTVKNNILYQNGNSNAVSYTGGASQPTGWTYTGNIIANPLLDSTFHLQAGSPAIDAGIDVGLPFNGTKPDIGAYETGTVTPGDTVAPSTSLTAPTTGTTVLGTTQQVAANATDNVGVTKVEFYIDGTTTLLNCTPNPDTTSPYLCIWNTTTVSNGTHTITSKAYDAAGNSAISSVVSVNVQNASSADTTAPVFTPTGALSSPSANLSVPVGTSYDIIAHATDNVGMAKVEFYKDGVLINTQTSGPNSDFTYSWNTIGLTVGSTHSWTAKAYDTASPANVSTTTARVITIGAGADTTPPTASITNAGGYYKGGTRMTLKATSSDNVGVTKTEFYVNDVKKCTDTTSPYTCSWSMPSSTTVTSYVIKAKAYDAAGNVGTSADVKMTNRKIAELSVLADAGPNQTITLPTNSVTLTGSYSTNTLTTTTTWSKVSGSGTITSPTSTTTTVTGLTTGTSVFQFTVDNGAGGTASATTTITVNPASTGSITFPSALILNGSPAGSTLSGGVSVELPSVTSTNTITKVEFYEGTNLIGTDNTSAPYSISTGWNTASVANGSHTFTAKAYDNQGNTATTPAVTYTVSN